MLILDRDLVPVFLVPFGCVLGLVNTGVSIRFRVRFLLEMATGSLFAVSSAVCLARTGNPIAKRIFWCGALPFLVGVVVGEIGRRHDRLVFRGLVFDSSRSV